MRSSVSYMLSHGSGEPTMSHPDYEQHAYHHGCLLVLIRGIGPSKPRSLQKIFERIQNTSNVRITDSSGTTRDIWVRYVRDHPVENNDWGDFQTHRRLLGLITVGKYDTQTELNELCRVHESLKVKYTNTLYDSRCILFGSNFEENMKIETFNNDENTPDTLKTDNLNSDDQNNQIVKGVNVLSNNNSNSDNCTAEDNSINSNNEKTTIESSFTTPSNFKSRAFFYTENDPCTTLESNIEEFINSMFWILESKRLERTREKVDKIALLLAPFEKKDIIGLDMDSRSNRKRCLGRLTKHLGDLTLQAGLVAESLNLFHAASETLSAISDPLWLGAANEGLCAASAILFYPHIREEPRNSLQQHSCDNRNEKINNEQVQQIPLQNTIISSINKQEQNQSNNLENHVVTDVTSAPSSSASSSTCSVSSILSTNSSSSTQSANAQDKKDNGVGVSLPSNILQPDEITNKYRDAIINYSKYRHAGIIETEAALKAARICIEQHQNLSVAMFLQNVLYINLNVSEHERVLRFETLTHLYQRIGYHRKAAFCYRLAAWRHIAQNNTNPDWSESYRLMLQSFPGHKLSLNPIEVLQNNAGWPCLQIDLLQQLVVAAKRLGHSALATRHMTFLLQTMWKHLTPTEQKELALQLKSLSAQCEGAPVPLVLENGTVIPPSNLTDIPFCENVQAKDVPSHLKPQKIAIEKIDDGPFIFTPIHFSSIDRRTQKKNESKISFLWVQHDLCEVTVKLKNVLPFELKVSDIRLLTNGIVFESLPQTVVLPTGISTLVTLHGTPIEYGILEIQGYSTHTLGVKSNCRLDNMNDRLFPPNYLIDVIPALPKLDIETSLPQTATFSGMTMADSVITSASLTLFNGECSECILTITNTSTIPIEFIECTLHSTLEDNLQNRIFSWSNSDIQNKLPIQPNTSIDIKIYIFGEADFLGSISNPTGVGATSLSTASNHNMNVDGPHSLSGGGGGGGTGIMNTLSVFGHISLPSRLNSPNNTPRRSELTSSFRSTRSGQSSLATLSLGASYAGNSARQIEAQLRLRYSGGQGLQEGYCRQCAVSLCLELLPSAQIINWDVLPAEMPSQFYLVLDVVNLTAQEMSLKYTTNKNILIEAKETCRFPVPVERCPLEKLLNSSTHHKDEYNDNQNSVMSVPLTDAELTERACSEHISNQVNLQWTLIGTETHGVASLKGMQLSSSMLGLITVAPLQWEITIDNTPISPQSEIKCCTGQNILFGVLIRNLSQTPLQQLTLTLQFYQDYQNGIHNYRLETRVTTSGPSQIEIECLNQNEHIYHEFSAIFFTPGIYKTDLQCCANTISQTALHSHNIREIGATTDSQIWRYIPPIEISVNE